MPRRKKSASQPPRGHVVHAMPGRVRLRVAERRGDTAYFQALLQALGEAPGVLDAQANVRTGSVLILHQGEAEAIFEAKQVRALLTRGVPPPVTPLRLRVAARAGRLDQAVRERTAGELDLAGVAGGVLVLLALLQLARGRVAAPALTLLWYALTAFNQGLLPGTAAPGPTAAGKPRKSKGD